MNKVEPEIIGEWWNGLPDNYKEELRIVIDCLSDNENQHYAWLQLLTGYFGARYIKTYIKLVLKAW